jgi:hypothetical protein
LDNTDADCPLAGYDIDGDGAVDDQDGDGILDCEERFLGTNKFFFDSDFDGISDGLETRFGTNPAHDDVLSDNLDLDNLSNGEEIRIHTDPLTDDAAHRSRYGYRYSIQRSGTGLEALPFPCNTDQNCASGTCINGHCACAAAGDCQSGNSCANGETCPSSETCDDNGVCSRVSACEVVTDLDATQTFCTETKHVLCYNYRVENISLLTTEANATQARGWNQIMLEFGQTPFDSPQDEGIYRVACVRASYLDDTGRKEPPNGEFVLPMTVWHDPTQFDAASDCYCPDGTLGTCQ